MRLTLIATKVKAFQASVTSLNLLKGVYKYTAGEHGFLAGLGGEVGVHWGHNTAAEWTLSSPN
jgi:thioredoxin reductase